MTNTSTWARIAIATAVLVSTPTLVRAQTSSPWSVDLAIGWDNSVSGDFLTGGIGTLQGAPVVLENTSWDEVYGTGVLFNVAVGYDLGTRNELRAGFTMQSTGSDDAQTIGTVSGGPLFANFDNYKAWTIDVGYRRYFAERAERFRPYVGGGIGLGIVSEIQADLAQTGAGLVLEDVDFYDGNGAVTFGGNAGLLYRLNDRFSLDARLGLRYVSGLADVEDAVFSGLDDVNEDSSRWTVPLTVGAKIRF
jgi:opacity protein-like surface antigen